MLLRMAIRNLIRRPIQSVLASGAVAAGLAVCVWMTNFQDGSWISMLDDSMRAVAGHVVVQAEGYQEDKDADLLVEDSGRIQAQLAGLTEDGVVLRRLFTEGLVASEANTVAVAVHGVENAEAQVSEMADKLTDGRWLQAGEALVGAKLATRLAVGVGDDVTITLGPSDDLGGVALRVAGIFETGASRTDSFFVLAPLADLQTLLPDRTDPATQVALQVPAIKAPRGLRDDARAAVSAVVSGHGGERRADLDVLTWQEAMPEALNAAKLDKAFTVFIWAVLAGIVSIGVLNLLLMSLFQRTREMGVMLAVGMRPREVMRLVVLEGAALGLLGCIVGWGLGQLLTIPMVIYGVDLVAMQDAAPVSNVAIDTVIHSRFIWGKGLLWFAWFFVLTVLASLWPALRAGSLSPVDAMRHV